MEQLAYLVKRYFFTVAQFGTCISFPDAYAYTDRIGRSDHDNDQYLISELLHRGFLRVLVDKPDHPGDHMGHRRFDL